MTAERQFGQVRAPGESAAEQRAWVVARSAYRQRPAQRPALPRQRRSRRSLAIAPALATLAALVAGLTLSPAGATVSRLIGQALGVAHAAPALFSLPAPGRLLLSGPAGTWTIAADGSTRRLGSWRQASWSPHGLYIAVARRDQLAVVDPHGAPAWTLARPAVRDPSWYGPNGFRIAYLSGHQLRVVAGDGTGDRPVANDVSPVAAVWRPDHPYQLAYVDPRGTVVVRDADSGRRIWTVRAGRVRRLQWSADGGRLEVLTSTAAGTYDQGGRLIARIAASTGVPLVDGSLSPDGRTLALIRGKGSPDVALAGVNAREPALHPVLSGPGVRQVLWAPDSRWLLVSWPAADQWVFIHVAGTPRIAAVSRIAQRFAAAPRRPGFPTLDAWCCTAQAGAR